MYRQISLIVIVFKTARLVWRMEVKQCWEVSSRAYRTVPCCLENILDVRGSFAIYNNFIRIARQVSSLHLQNFLKVAFKFQDKKCLFFLCFLFYRLSFTCIFAQSNLSLISFLSVFLVLSSISGAQVIWLLQQNTLGRR